MIAILMNIICSAHKKRGEEVQEFNLSPHYYKKLKSKEFNYHGLIIPIVCEGWIKVKDYYYLELETTHGNLLTNQITYRLK